MFFQGVIDKHSWGNYWIKLSAVGESHSVGDSSAKKTNLSQHRDNNHSLQTQWSEQSGQQEWKQHEQKKDPGPDVEIEHTAEWICIFTELLPVEGEILLFSTLNPIIWCPTNNTCSDFLLQPLFCRGQIRTGQHLPAGHHWSSTVSH